MGRYSHEAVAVDPNTYRIYLTEDAVNPNGLYYRWTPPRGFRPRRGSLRKLMESEGAAAGRLQAMSCRQGRRQIVDLSEATEAGTRYKVLGRSSRPVGGGDARPAAGLREAGHPVAQARGAVVGQRRRVLRVELRPPGSHRRRQPQCPRLVDVSRRGHAYSLARNDNAENGEFCGPTFSLDGWVLFTDIQSPIFGATFAITGPWHR